MGGSLKKIDLPDDGNWQPISWLRYFIEVQTLPSSRKNKFFRRRHDGGWVYCETTRPFPPPVLNTDRRVAVDYYAGTERRANGRNPSAKHYDREPSPERRADYETDN